ncbi:helix-turn-helix domain-containing protein [bacterium]|nr:helix-turn-helix domain-containing protein [bacterium]
MRRKDESKKPIIADFINAFFYEHDKVPSVREIVEGTGIPLSTVHRYLVDMQEKGELVPIETLEEINDAEFIVNCPKCKRQFALIRHQSYPVIPLELIPYISFVTTY